MRIKWFSFVRIAGLLLVLTYHFFKNTYPGGFIGVDIFFTFSGFLITALMLDEFAATQHFQLLAFYRRRFYRIVPPLVLSILVVVPLTYLISPNYITGLGKQIAAAIGFTTNYFEIMTGGSYESKFMPHLFVHTWSLAVEMHFYLIWGFLMAIFTQIIRRFNFDNARKAQIFRLSVGIVSLILALESFTAMAIGSAGLTDFSKVYFSSVTHSFPFFVGALLASFTGIKSIPRAFERLMAHANAFVVSFELILTFAVLGLLGLRLQFSSRATYTGGILLASLLAALAILLARMLHHCTPNQQEPRWATFIADISYSLYLYHWPLFVIFSQLVSVPWAVVITLVIGIPCSALSYYIIEPLIAGKQPHALHNFHDLRPLKQGLLAATVALMAVTGYTAYHAPVLTGLERQLWIGGIYQAADQMTTTKNVVMAAVKQHKVKLNATAKIQAPKGVSIIGDSVTLGTRDYLGKHVADSTIDAKGERTMDLAYQVMMTQQKNHVLRQNVVICIGTNALDGWQAQLDHLIRDLEPGHHLILVTPYDQRATPDWNSSKVADYERTLPAKFDFITVSDWQRLAAKHPEVFKGTDGVHFAGRESGDIIYAQAVNDGLKAAAKTPLKK
ncbi:acyltransferase family protein [Lactiplantibacillus sp. WILCCON 0030]|uniref:Acyltransferase family protein n=1 Tax=Lactiplantibacillus brownii TaxID=3069269 RepID=A0ABU1AD59_9LACO|nr:acyltransferase family protein [Lactiplantibacillus brownii]MDQ7938313.1 acyltransferase family protein [Lactiplantibacillus brownii]